MYLKIIAFLHLIILTLWIKHGYYDKKNFHDNFKCTASYYIT